MWLLDANLDIHLVELLKNFQIDCDRAENRGWKALRNGELAPPPYKRGSTTKDLLFAESASQIWRTFPDFGVVVVTLPQLPSKRYLEAFARAWAVTPIHPVGGTVVSWP